MTRKGRRQTQQAVAECGRWLVGCLDLGWSRNELDFLEALWWLHHDDLGRLKSDVGRRSPGPGEGQAE